MLPASLMQTERFWFNVLTSVINLCVVSLSEFISAMQLKLNLAGRIFFLEPLST